MTESGKKSAYYRVGMITALFGLIYALPNFVILAYYLPQRMSLRATAGWLEDLLYQL